MISTQTNTYPAYDSHLPADLAMATYLYERFNTQVALTPHPAKNSMTPADKALFSTLYLLYCHALEQGHTLFFLNRNTTTDSKFAPFLSAMIEYMASYLAHFEFEEAFLSSCETLIYHSNDNAIKDYIYRQSILAAERGRAESDIETLKVILATFFDCVRYMHHTFKSIDEFYEHLSTNPFCVPMSKLVVASIDTYPRPLVLSTPNEQGFGIWLYRLWQAEASIAKNITKLLSSRPTSKNPDLSALNQAQRDAVLGALGHHFAMITGGPGTGKTYTIARLVLTLLQNNASHQALRLALVAPTGKAAMRMQESLVNNLPKDTDLTLQAMTVHRLLGIGGQALAKYHQDNPLPYDVVIVDEASMLGVELAAKLFSAIKKGTQLILLGDSHQLSAVEAGSVLGDLCQTERLMPFHHRLTESKRFDEHSGVGQLATWINKPSKKSFTGFEALLAKLDGLYFFDSKTHSQTDIVAQLCAQFVPFIDACEAIKYQTKNAQTLDALFYKLNAFRVLCAGHQGALSDTVINEHIALFHLTTSDTHHHKKQVPKWYHGRVVMITKNSYELGLYNGDTGICLLDDGELKVYFEKHDTGFLPIMLKDELIASAYAITIHKSQGSEFERVAICLEDTQARLLSKELLYTAVTRAKHALELYASKEALLSALNSQTIRHTGLSLLFDGIEH